jgi:thioredoxin-related protein
MALRNFHEAFVMVRRFCLVICSWLFLSGLSVAAELTPESLEPGMINPGYHEQPDWFKQSFLDIREDVTEAADAGKRVVLYFYQDGCPYCKKLLEENFGQRSITGKAREHFEFIAINIWGDREVTGLDGQATTEKAFAESLRVMFTPTLLFLNEDGKVVLRLNGYYAPHKFMTALDYVAGHVETAGTFRDYLARVEPQPARGELHQQAKYIQPPFDLVRREGTRPLLVLFEQKHCAACDELHLDIFERRETRQLLEKFDIVLLDMWSQTSVTLPDGQQTTAADWARDHNIQYAPSMVLFDDRGREVFRTEAYLKAFHTQSVLDYVASGAYRRQPNFQRFIQARAEALEAQGIHVDIMD